MSSKSWLTIAEDSPFSLANIPFGIISTHANAAPRTAIAIGGHALDLSAFALGGGFSALPEIQNHLAVFQQPTLNNFAALGQPIHNAVRTYIQQVFSEPSPHAKVLQASQVLQQSCLVPLKDVTTHLPMQIGDYTDFYAGLNHAFNVGVLFRGAQNALQPNYTHLPVGYHGRASSVVVSDTSIRRPCGQILPAPGATEPIFGACKRLDMELELAAFICTPSTQGVPIKINDAASHIFGYVLMNDWSARDIQAWEYVPLGPFGSKNFGTSVSPWVVLPSALEPLRAAGQRAQSSTLPTGAAMPQTLPYLTESSPNTTYNIDLEVSLRVEGSQQATVISKTNAQNLLYSMPQMVTHHTVTGCNMNTGDLLGSGTISGTQPGTLGSLLEQTKGGKEPIKLDGGEERTFLQDGDEVIMTGVGGPIGARVGFGECRGIITPALVQ